MFCFLPLLCPKGIILSQLAVSNTKQRNVKLSFCFINRKWKKMDHKISVCRCSEFWPVQSWSSFPYGHWQRQLSLWATGRWELQPESCLNSDQRLKVPIVLCFYQKMSVLLVSTRRERLSAEIISTIWRPTSAMQLLQHSSTLQTRIPNRTL